MQLELPSSLVFCLSLCLRVQTTTVCNGVHGVQATRVCNGLYGVQTTTVCNGRVCHHRHSPFGFNGSSRQESYGLVPM